MRRKANAKIARQIQAEGTKLLRAQECLTNKLSFYIVNTPEMRSLFDQAGDEIHYAGACQRVGRCMRLAIVYKRQWVGGIVLGSTFPNIKPRDEAFGLSCFIKGWQEKQLISPWARENRRYWKGLQLIVNHARTFIFPAFQGNGVGVAAHALLLTEGKRLWEEQYGDPVYGFDTLCTHPGSKLFADNGWELVGRTQGYSRDPSQVFSKRAFVEDWKNIKDNAGLRKLAGNKRWWIWVRVFHRFDRDE